MTTSIMLILVVVTLFLASFANAQQLTCVMARFPDRNIDKLAKRTLEAAGYTTSNAGVYLTVDQVVKMTAQPPSFFKPLTDFLANQTIYQQYTSPFKDWIQVCVVGSVNLPDDVRMWLNANTLYTNSWLIEPSSSKRDIQQRDVSKKVMPKNAKSIPPYSSYFPGPPYGYNQLCSAAISFTTNASTVVFPHGSQLASPGVYSIKEMMNNVNLQANWIGMLPCDESSGIVKYARGKGCDIVVQNFFKTTLPSQTIPYVPSPFQNVTTSTLKLKKMKCGDVAKKAGISCSTIKSKFESESGIRTDIDSETLVYIIDQSTLPKFPKNVMVQNWDLLFTWKSGKFAGTSSWDPCAFDIRNHAQGSWVTSNPKWLAKQYDFFSSNSRRQVSTQCNTKPKRVKAMVTIPGYYEYVPQDLTLALQGTGKSAKVTVPKHESPYFGNSLLPDLCWTNPNNISTYGPWTVISNCGEPSLDVQMLAELGSSSLADLYFLPSSKNSFLREIQKDTMVSFLTLESMPMVDILSLSFGGTYYANNPLDPAGVALIEGTFLKLAAVGVSIMSSSGDEGAAGTGNGTCAPGVAVNFPTASAWVTSVGATQWASVNGKLQEIACVGALGGSITSGGGFNPYTKRPSWQKDVVDQYLAKYSKSKGFPNSTTPFYAPDGRGYPDIALSGWYTPIVTGGVVFSESGTSVAAPTMAGMLTQILVKLRQIPGWEKETLGFMTPFLYWAKKHCPQTFNDITLGNNIYSGQEGLWSDLTMCQAGYPATKGWDAVTGLGSVNQVELFNAAKAYIKLQRKARGLKN